MHETRRQHPRVAATIEVRYKRREDFVLEYARDISLGGLYVASDDPLGEGERVELRLVLPDLPQAVALAGKVVRVVHSATKGGSGMGIAFDEIDEFTLDTLRTYLGSMVADRECVVDRRGRSVRFDQVLEVRYDSIGEFLVDYSQNLSKNGIFVNTDAPQPVDTVVPMKLTLPNGETIEVTGRVVHCIPRSDGVASGMGIEFVHFHGSGQERLWTYIESLS